MRMQVTTLREQMTVTDEMFASDGCEVLCQVTTSLDFSFVVIVVMAERL